MGNWTYAIFQSPTDACVDDLPTDRPWRRFVPCKYVHDSGLKVGIFGIEKIDWNYRRILSKNFTVRNKLKCPLFIASEMSGFG
jgi:hypothetical protein